MIASINSCIHQGRKILYRLQTDTRLHTTLRIISHLLSGFFLTASSLGNLPQCFALGLVCASSGWPAVLIALGGCIGYPVFWGIAGTQGIVWMVTGLGLALLADLSNTPARMPLLIPLGASLIAAASGLLFQIRFADTTPILIYLLRILLAGASAQLFLLREKRAESITTWLTWGVAVLALAQIAPAPWLSFGMVAAGALCTSGAFPAVALGGLALDLAQVTSVPMTAVVCLSYFLRFIPRIPPWVVYFAPSILYLAVMGLCDLWDLNPVAGLLLGGVAGIWLPGQSKVYLRRGETGIAQVRLEMAAGVLSQAQMLLMDATAEPIDEGALIQRAAQNACGGCPARKSCKGRTALETMSPELLHKPLLDGQDLPIVCRKEGRLLQELHRSQEQLRTIRGDRSRQAEYRTAVIQQYRFLSEFLQDLSDNLGRRASSTLPRYAPEVIFHANRKESENGDRCQCFAGTGCKYYVLLCDGMGTGLGAVQEGKSAAQLLKKLLLAGFPAEYALRSLNSLCALRGIAGAATVDLAELQLDTGKVMLYKWGAAPSYLLCGGSVEKIGTAGPPPGLSVTDGREKVERLSLRRGEILVLLSDGVGGEDALQCRFSDGELPLGDLAVKILDGADTVSGDDATVAVIRLSPESTKTS